MLRIDVHDASAQPINPLSIPGLAGAVIVRLTEAPSSASSRPRAKELSEAIGRNSLGMPKTWVGLASILSNARKLAYPGAIVAVCLPEAVGHVTRIVGSFLGFTYLETMTHVFRRFVARNTYTKIDVLQWVLFRTPHSFEDLDRFDVGHVNSHGGLYSRKIMMDAETEKVADEIDMAKLFFGHMRKKDELGGASRALRLDRMYPIDAARHILLTINPGNDKLIVDMFAEQGCFASAATIEGLNYLGLVRSEWDRTTAEKRIDHWYDLRDRVKPIYKADSGKTIDTSGGLVRRPCRYRSDQVKVIEAFGGNFTATVHHALDYALGTRSDTHETKLGVPAPGGCAQGMPLESKPSGVMRNPPIRPDHLSVILGLARKGYNEQDVFRVCIDLWLCIEPSPDMPTKQIVNRMRRDARKIANLFERTGHIEALC